MLILFIVSVIIGVVLAGVTGLGFLGIIAGVICFVCGLPFAVITGCINDAVSRRQDREDYREAQRELAEMERDLNRETAEDIRMDRLIDTLEDRRQRRHRY